MRTTEFESRPWLSATFAVIVANLVVYLFQNINLVYFGFRFETYLALQPPAVARGCVWQLITYSFLHASNWHFFLNALCLYFFGRYVEEMLGRGRMLEVYFFSALAGGLLQSVLGWIFPGHFGIGSVMGASAAIFGLVAVFSMLDPDRTILLWFVLPVKARYFLVGSAVIAIFFILVPSNPSVAHAAHLGGILGGVLYVYGFVRADRSLLNWRRDRSVEPSEELVKAPAKRSLWKRSQVDAEEDLPAEEFISREVDPILDKISAHGLHSLTKRERQILEAARRKMAKR